MRLITDPALDGITGQFFDGLATARALPEAYDPQFRAELGEITGQMIGQASLPKGRQDRQAPAGHGGYPTPTAR